jgi:hypothetical protein
MPTEQLPVQPAPSGALLGRRYPETASPHIGSTTVACGLPSTAQAARKSAIAGRVKKAPRALPKLGKLLGGWRAGHRASHPRWDVFMIAPAVLHFALTIVGSPNAGTTLAPWICFGISGWWHVGRARAVRVWRGASPGTVGGALGLRAGARVGVTAATGRFPPGCERVDGPIHTRSQWTTDVAPMSRPTRYLADCSRSKSAPPRPSELPNRAEIARPITFGRFAEGRRRA